MDIAKTSTIGQARTKSNNKVIEINNLRKGFGQQEVLKNVSLQLFNGENLVVLGKSGSGKSVLIKCIVRLLKSDTGTINVLGENVNALNSDRIRRSEKENWFSFSERGVV